METEKQIVIRNEEVNEVLSRPPIWIVRWGISIILLLLIIGITASFYIEYPDTLDATAEVTAINPPVYLTSNTSGRLQHLLSSNKDSVATDEVIGVIENTARYQDVLRLQLKIDSLQNQDQWSVASGYFNLDSAQLGDLTTAYYQFLNAQKAYELFVMTDAQEKEIRALGKQLAEYKSLQSKQRKQKEIQQQELDLKKLDFERHKSLYEVAAIAKSEFEAKKTEYLSMQRSFEGQNIAVSSTTITIAGIEKNVIQLELAQAEQREKLKTEISEKLETLKSSMLDWKKKYLIISPINGLIEFTNLWKENQLVQAGAQLFVVSPKNDGQYLAKLVIPSVNAGKVSMGQRVNIELENFNSTEYGLLVGEVIQISNVPIESQYFVDVALPNGLHTSYGKELPPRDKSIGKAIIITEKRKLSDRIIVKFRAITRQ